MNDALVLTRPGYFRLRVYWRWLYRLVRKHGGRQSGLALRHAPSLPEVGRLQRPSDFALQVRHLVRRQAVPGYRLAIERWPHRMGGFPAGYRLGRMRLIHRFC